MAALPAYLDYNATTPIADEVRAAVLEHLDHTSGFGNPSSSHAYGRAAKAAVDQARANLASLLNCTAAEIVFVSCGTEANNLAIKGVLLSSWARESGRGHMVISAIEHPAVSEPCETLVRLFPSQMSVSRVPVDAAGRVRLADVAAALRPDTALVSIMLANNEIGTCADLAQIARLAHAAGALVHTDAAQCPGKMRVDFAELGVDLMSIVGHKMYAPKGVGALVVRHDCVRLARQCDGAGQEAGLRGGTENVALIAGLGAAARLLQGDGEALFMRLRDLRDLLKERLTTLVPDLLVLTPLGPGEALPNTLAVCCGSGLRSNELLREIESLVAASAGSACHSGHVVAGATVTALGVPASHALGMVRFSIGRWTTVDDVERAAAALSAAVQRLLGAHSSPHF